MEISDTEEGHYTYNEAENIDDLTLIEASFM